MPVLIQPTAHHLVRTFPSSGAASRERVAFPALRVQTGVPAPMYAYAYIDSIPLDEPIRLDESFGGCLIRAQYGHVANSRRPDAVIERYVITLLEEKAELAARFTFGLPTWKQVRIERVIPRPPNEAIGRWLCLFDCMDCCEESVQASVRAAARSREIRIRRLLALQERRAAHVS